MGSLRLTEVCGCCLEFVFGWMVLEVQKEWVLELGIVGPCVAGTVPGGLDFSAHPPFELMMCKIFQV